MSLALIQSVFHTARQLLCLVRATPKWNNVWLVLEAGDGFAAGPYYGRIINCVTGTEAAKPSEREELFEDWRAFRGGTRVRRRAAQAVAVAASGSGNKPDVGSDGATASNNKDGDEKQKTGSG